MFIRNLYECLEDIRNINERNLGIIDNLEKENDKLKDKHFKDAELSDMKNRLEKMQDDYWRGFPISEQEEKSIEEWKKKHDEEDHGYTPQMRIKAEGCCGGRYKYIFVPTSLGVSGKVVCHCGAEFEFQEIG